jgi:Uma2 family endonuclease
MSRTIKEIVMALPQREEYYTYADYRAWDDERRWELIDGIPYMMAAPSRTHQRILVELSRQLANFLADKPCEVYVAPFDVRLNALGDDDGDVFQPDILVVCDEAKLDDKGLNGAPDMAIEISSPSTATRDKVLKFNKYQQVGVREYWIVNPADKTVSVYILENGNYIARNYGETGAIPVHVLEGCEISLADVFPEDQINEQNI